PGNTGVLTSWSLELTPGGTNLLPPVPEGRFHKFATPPGVTQQIGDLAGVPGTAIPPVRSVIPVSGLKPRVADVKVSLSISHSDIRDLNIGLISPWGTRVTLFTPAPNQGVGLASNDNLLLATFSDQSFRAVTSAVAPFSD